MRLGQVADRALINESQSINVPLPNGTHAEPSFGDCRLRSIKTLADVGGMQNASLSWKNALFA